MQTWSLSISQLWMARTEEKLNYLGKEPSQNLKVLLKENISQAWIFRFSQGRLMDQRQSTQASWNLSWNLKRERSRARSAFKKPLTETSPMEFRGGWMWLSIVKLKQTDPGLGESRSCTQKQDSSKFCGIPRKEGALCSTHP